MRTSRMRPAPPLGYGPQPELYGQVGKEPTKMRTRMTIRTIDTARPPLRAPSEHGRLAFSNSTSGGLPRRPPVNSYRL